MSEDGLNPCFTIEPGLYREIGSGKTVTVSEVVHHTDVAKSVFVWFSRVAGGPSEFLPIAEFSKKFARIV